LLVSEVSSTVPAVFKIVSDGCSGRTIQAGGECLISVRFSLDTVGEVAGELKIVDNSESGNETAQLTGSNVKLSQTILVRDVPHRQPGSAPIVLSAKSTSGLPISYSVISGRATLRGSELIPMGPEPIVIRASQPGNDRFAEAKSVEQVY